MAGNAAVIVGAGSGLGAALGRRFAASGMSVVLAARNGDAVAELAGQISAEAPKPAGTVWGWPADATDEAVVADLFARVEAEIGAVTVAVYNAGMRINKPITELSAEDYETCWRLGAFGGFLTGREAARHMTKRNAGSILFTGATASLRGGSGSAAFAGGKFALRALAQSMARELGPKGIHVAHVVIDGGIDTPRSRSRFPDRDPATLLDPNALAEAYFDLHSQPRSTWTFELDVRPFSENF